MCDFQAQSLLQKRRTAFDGRDVETGIAVIQEIDRLRWDHEEKTHCDCWKRAMDADPNSLSPKEVA